MSQGRKIKYTKMVLRESLMELMKTRPIAEISIKEICALADISRSTFYAHYKDQYDLLRKTEEETIETVNGILNKYNHLETRQGALQMIEETLQYVADNNNSVQVLLSENGNIGFQKDLFSSMYQRQIMMKFFGSKTIDEKTKEYCFMFIVTGSIGLIYHWIKNSMSTPVHELAALIFNLTKQIGW